MTNTFEQKLHNRIEYILDIMQFQNDRKKFYKEITRLVNDALEEGINRGFQMPESKYHKEHREKMKQMFNSLDEYLHDSDIKPNKFGDYNDYIETNQRRFGTISQES